MFNPVLMTGRPMTLAPKLFAPIRLLLEMASSVYRYFHPPVSSDKPAWVRCTDRAWQRHSAYLMTLYSRR